MKHKKPDDGAYDHGDGCDDVLSRASSLQACECETQRQKNQGSKVAMLPGKFL